ncbi:MAG TPA: hypothetical protein PK268_05820 [Enterococcus sp.]|nr:hypothetical protein [Enterococcus sp.]
MKHLILSASDILPKDWEYILTVGFVLSLLTIEPQWDFERLYESKEANLSRFSFELFEKYFRKLTVQEKQKIAKQLYRHYLGKQLGVEKLFFTAIDQLVISDQHPLLNKKFEQLWQEWSTKVPKLTSEALQQEYLHLCYRYADSETLFPIVRVNMQSSLPKETVNHIQWQISHYLKNSATVVFGVEPADFSITTEEKCTRHSNQFYFIDERLRIYSSKCARRYQKTITSKKLRVLSLSFFVVQKEFLLESFFFW